MGNVGTLVAVVSQTTAAPAMAAPAAGRRRRGREREREREQNQPDLSVAWCSLGGSKRGEVHAGGMASPRTNLEGTTPWTARCRRGTEPSRSVREHSDVAANARSGVVETRMDDNTPWAILSPRAWPTRMERLS